MAENKTIEERLAEIEAKKEAERKARAKKKAAEAKADAEYAAKKEIEERIARENMQRASLDAPRPQVEAGKNARKDQRTEDNTKSSITSKYGVAYRRREDLIDKYRKTGDPKDKQAALNAQAALDPIVAEYVKVFGTEPPGYKPNVVPSKVTDPTKEQKGETTKPVVTPGSMQGAEDRRGSSPNVASPIIAQVTDPNVQAIINAAAKNGIQLSVAEATAKLPGTDPDGTGNTSMASTRRQTTQYTMQQVRSAADGIYQNSVGRALNDDELRMLYQSLNNTLKQNPTITETSATGDSVITGGVDERGFMQQQAEANPEFASYQKATTYFDAMLSTLQGPVGGGI